MRNKIAISALVVVTAAVGVLAVQDWNRSVIKQRLIKQGEIAQAATVERLRSEAEDKEAARFKAQCEAGLKAYNALTPAQRVGKTKPDCTLNQVQ
jgi:hypothetical protein